MRCLAPHTLNLPLISATTAIYSSNYFLLQIQAMQLSTLPQRFMICKHPLSPPASSLPLESTFNDWGAGADEQMLPSAILRVDYSERFRYPYQGWLVPSRPLVPQPRWCSFILAFSLPCSKIPPAQQTAYTESFSGSAFGEQGLLLLDTPTLLHGENGVDTPNLYFFLWIH